MSKTVALSEQPLLSVVIPCLNMEKLLHYQLQSLVHQQCSSKWEVVIVDNGSTDGTVAVAEGFRNRLPALTIISEPRRGRHHACNTGVRVSRGAYIVFVDGDDEVNPGFLEAMISALQKWPAVGGRLEHGKMRPNREVSFGRIQTDALINGFGFLPYAGGAAFGIQKTTFEAIGGYQDKPYCEDADLSWRLQLAGQQIHFESNASVSIRQRGTLKQMFRQHRNFGEARALLYRDYRIHGMKRRPVKEALSEWFKLSYSIFRLRTFDQRARWVRRLGKCVGHVTGSIKYRTFFP